MRTVSILNNGVFTCINGYTLKECLRPSPDLELFIIGTNVRNNNKSHLAMIDNDVGAGPVQTCKILTQLYINLYVKWKLVLHCDNIPKHSKIMTYYGCFIYLYKIIPQIHILEIMSLKRTRDVIKHCLSLYMVPIPMFYFYFYFILALSPYKILCMYFLMCKNCILDRRLCATSVSRGHHVRIILRTYICLFMRVFNGSRHRVTYFKWFFSPLFRVKFEFVFVEGKRATQQWRRAGGNWIFRRLFSLTISGRENWAGERKTKSLQRARKNFPNQDTTKSGCEEKKTKQQRRRTNEKSSPTIIPLVNLDSLVL